MEVICPICVTDFCRIVKILDDGTEVKCNG